jgi:2-methylcitrate dehydratase PrpD
MAGIVERLARFISVAVPPSEARARASAAILDTVGVTLAGAVEPAARIARSVAAQESAGASIVFGAAERLSPSAAALANGTAAHALDYDDMCFVSLAHPSAPLVAGAVAAAEAAAASGAALLEAYAVGFEIETRLGSTMNPRHYERGWHCTSTLGTVGTAAAAARLLGLDAEGVGHALGIAASSACGLKENFGTMVKPLHAGLAARNGVIAALLARHGMQASSLALDGPQGFLAAMDSERGSLDEAAADLGTRWEIVDSGITVKLYPSCAGTHPTLDVLLDLRRRHALVPEAVESVAIDVDSITPTVLIYPRPASGLQGKFSMPFCAAAALVEGRVAVDTFTPEKLADERIGRMMARVEMRVDSRLDGAAPPLTQARIRIRLTDGEELTASANGARGYAERPASARELDEKFLACAAQVLPPERAASALAAMRAIERAADVRNVTSLLAASEEALPTARIRASIP